MISWKGLNRTSSRCIPIALSCVLSLELTDYVSTSELHDLRSSRPCLWSWKCLRESLALSTPSYDIIWSKQASHHPRPLREHPISPRLFRRLPSFIARRIYCLVIIDGGARDKSSICALYDITAVQQILLIAMQVAAVLSDLDSLNMCVSGTSVIAQGAIDILYSSSCCNCIFPLA